MTPLSVLRLRVMSPYRMRFLPASGLSVLSDDRWAGRIYAEPEPLLSFAIRRHELHSAEISQFQSPPAQTRRPKSAFSFQCPNEVTRLSKLPTLTSSCLHFDLSTWLPRGEFTFSKRRIIAPYFRFKRGLLPGWLYPPVS